MTRRHGARPSTRSPRVRATIAPHNAGQVADRGTIMTTTETNSAYDYAQIIRGEIIAVETLLDNWGYVAGVEPEDIDPDILAEVNTALKELGLDNMPLLPVLYDDGADIMADYLNNSCLEMNILKVVSGDSDATRVEILRTCGGPRCDITRDSNDGTVVEISVHDGQYHSVVRVNVPTLAAGLDDLAGCY